MQYIDLSRATGEILSNRNFNIKSYQTDVVIPGSPLVSSTAAAAVTAPIWCSTLRGGSPTNISDSSANTATAANTTTHSATATATATAAAAAMSLFVPTPVRAAIASETFQELHELREITTVFIKLETYSLAKNRDLLTLQPFFLAMQEILATSGGFLRQFLVW